MANSIRDKVVDALAEYTAGRWGCFPDDANASDVREQAKEIANVVFGALGISPTDQDREQLPAAELPCDLGGMRPDS